MPLYRMTDLLRRYGDSTVLNIDQLTIQPGQISTLIGPNGAGKTTLLQILAFLDRPTSGRLEFCGEEVVWQERQLLPLRRQVVLVDQYPIMFSGTVRRNVEYGLKLRQVAQAERRRRAMEVLAEVGMEAFADQDARSLSGGENKRVALARALVLQPEVLLCDEPTANVDSENQEIILRILLEQNRDRNTSIIFSTHYLSQGQRLAHHSLMLQQGSLSVTVSDNSFRVGVVSRSAERVECRLRGQLLISLPATLVPAAAVCRLHLDPARILVNPVEAEAVAGTRLVGEVVELASHGSRVRLVVDVGVRLVVFLDSRHYRQKPLSLGERLELVIPVSAMSCEAVDTLP